MVGVKIEQIGSRSMILIKKYKVSNVEGSIIVSVDSIGATTIGDMWDAADKDFNK